MRNPGQLQRESRRPRLWQGRETIKPVPHVQSSTRQQRIKRYLHKDWIRKKDDARLVHETVPKPKADGLNRFGQQPAIQQDRGSTSPGHKVQQVLLGVALGVVGAKQSQLQPKWQRKHRQRGFIIQPKVSIGKGENGRSGDAAGGAAVHWGVLPLDKGSEAYYAWSWLYHKLRSLRPQHQRRQTQARNSYSCPKARSRKGVHEGNCLVVLQVKEAIEAARSSGLQDLQVELGQKK